MRGISPPFAPRPSAWTCACATARCWTNAWCSTIASGATLTARAVRWWSLPIAANARKPKNSTNGFCRRIDGEMRRPRSERVMSDAGQQVLPKDKKSVALSGVAAGNTAVCTVGRSGNDLHYRGYDIADLAMKATFEEVAYLLVHERLPTWSELKSYREKLKRLRGLPQPVKSALELLPAAPHPMDELRTGASILGTVLPEKDDHNLTGARDIADRLMASFGSMLLYWYHYSHNGKRIETKTDDDSFAGHFLHLLHGRKPSELHSHALY